MKKRYMAVLMASAVMLGLAACGKVETKDVKEDTEQSVSVEKEEEAEGGEDTSSEKEDGGEVKTDETKETASGPSLDITTNYYDAGEENTGYIYGYYPSVEVIGDNYPELKSSISEWFANYKSNYESQAQQYTEDAKIDAESMGENFYGYSLNYSAKAARLDNRIASIILDESSYTGGAHGYDYMYGITFDTQTGEEITFEKLGVSKEEIRPFIDEYIRQKREEGYTFDFYEDTIDDLLTSPSAWYLNGNGLNIVFNAYEIASYAEGRTIVTIPYSEMESFNPDYVLDGNAMFAELVVNEAVSVDVDGDGTLDTVELVSDYDENGDMQPSIKLEASSLDNKESVLKLDSCGYMTNCYLVKAGNGRSFVLFSCDMMSDDFVTQLIEVTSGKPENLDSISGNLTSISNDMIRVDAAVYVLGTYSSKRSYTFAEGTLQPVEDRYTFSVSDDKSGHYGPKLKEELTVQIEENGTMVEKTLPAGTVIYPVNSDGESVVGFELEDGTYGEITFERTDSGLSIDGVSEFDLFDDLPYAG